VWSSKEVRDKFELVSSLFPKTRWTREWLVLGWEESVSGVDREGRWLPFRNTNGNWYMREVSEAASEEITSLVEVSGVHGVLVNTALSEASGDDKTVGPLGPLAAPVNPSEAPESPDKSMDGIPLVGTVDIRASDGVTLTLVLAPSVMAPDPARALPARWSGICWLAKYPSLMV
jgi:hypothetical protein